MAKRFIDTEIFNDEWVGSLSKDGKLFFIYFITQCDHAGVLKLNRRLCEFQTGLKSLDTLIKELSDTLVTVKDGVYFMPKFLKFQYPNFPQSSVRQQDSALKILISLGLWDEKLNTYQTVSKELPNSYVNDSVNVKEKKDVSEIEKLPKTEIDIEFEKFQAWIKKEAPILLKLKTQLTVDNYQAIKKKIDNKELSWDQVKNTLLAMGNYLNIEKKYNSVYLTMLSWIERDKTFKPKQPAKEELGPRGNLRLS